MADTCHVEESCTRPVRAWGMCGTHWRRWRKWGDPYWAEPKSGVRPPNFKQSHCNVDGCGGQHHSHGFCSNHSAAYVKYGNPTAKGNPGRKRKRDITHAGAHRRVRYDRGRAAEHDCVDCGRPAEEWSLRHDVSDECRQEGWVRGRRDRLIWQVWSTSSQDYDPRCRVCHREYDAAGRGKEGQPDG